MGWGDTLKAAVPCVLAVALTGPAAAADIAVYGPDSHGRIFIDVTGEITFWDVYAFQEKTNQIYPIGADSSKKQVIVTLASPGGNVQGLRIGELIREKGMATLVPDNRQCASVCALLWLAGTPRTVGGKNVRIGFHSTATRRFGPVSDSGNAKVASYLTKLGLRDEAITGMTKAPPKKMTWLEPKHAKEWGVIREVMRPPRARSLAKFAPQNTRQVLTVEMPTHLQSKKRQDPEWWSSDWLTERKAALKFEQAGSREALPVLTSPQLATDSPALTSRVVLDEEGSVGSTIGLANWRNEGVTSSEGQAADIAVRCDIEIPERRIAMTISIRRNTDKSLPASHTVEIAFKVPTDFPFGGISDVPGIRTKHARTKFAVPMSGASVKVTSDLFLLGLSGFNTMPLLREGSWFEIPVIYGNGHRAIIAVEKGTTGERAFNEAFTAWAQAKSGGLK